MSFVSHISTAGVNLKTKKTANAYIYLGIAIKLISDHHTELLVRKKTWPAGGVFFGLDKYRYSFS